MTRAYMLNTNTRIRPRGSGGLYSLVFVFTLGCPRKACPVNTYIYSEILFASSRSALGNYRNLTHNLAYTHASKLGLAGIHAPLSPRHGCDGALGRQETRRTKTLGARRVVGHVLQAPPSPVVCRAPCACAADLRVGGRAQLIGLRRDQDECAQPPRARRVRQARLLPRGLAPARQAADGGIQAGRGEVGLRF